VSLYGVYGLNEAASGFPIFTSYLGHGAHFEYFGRLFSKLILLLLLFFFFFLHNAERNTAVDWMNVMKS
jgi:hypothetical protein